MRPRIHLLSRERCAVVCLAGRVTKKPLRAMLGGLSESSRLTELFEYRARGAGMVVGPLALRCSAGSGELGRPPTIGAGSAEADLETVGVRFVCRGPGCGVSRRTSVWSLAVDFIPKAFERRATKCLI